MHSLLQQNKRNVNELPSAITQDLPDWIKVPKEQINCTSFFGEPGQVCCRNCSLLNAATFPRTVGFFFPLQSERISFRQWIHMYPGEKLPWFCSQFIARLPVFHKNCSSSRRERSGTEMPEASLRSFFFLQSACFFQTLVISSMCLELHF